MTRRRWLLLGELVLVAAVLAAAVLAFSRARAKADGDEAEWIGTSRYFLTLFVERDLSAEAWADKYWTRTQPMVARYVIGAWLWARGYDLTALNPAYNHDRSWEANQRLGRAPAYPMLDEARVAMRALAVVAVAVVYLVARVLAGPVAGLAAAGLFVGSPYLAEHLIRAKGDTTMLLFLLLALTAALIALRHPERGPSLPWGTAAGIFLGLAMGSKLTAFLAALALALWAILATGARRRPGRGGSRTTPTDSPLAWASVVLLTAALVFVASNPYLWSDPVGRTWILFQNRQAEMDVQVATEPWRAYNSVQERAMRVLERSLLHETWGASYLGIPLEAILSAVGVGWLLWRSVRRPDGGEALLLAWSICLFIGVSLGLRYLLQHYFLPTTVTALVLAGVGAGAPAMLLGRGLLAVRRRVSGRVARVGPAPARTPAGAAAEG